MASAILLEGSGYLLAESDSSHVLLESSVPSTGSGAAILLESGFYLLTESDGSHVLIESSVLSDALLLESGFYLLAEDGVSHLLREGVGPVISTIKTSPVIAIWAGVGNV